MIIDVFLCLAEWLNVNYLRGTFNLTPHFEPSSILFSAFLAASLAPFGVQGKEPQRVGVSD